ncbi:MAG TPA: heme o synthase [Chlamydiales bacterium]|nr:heme o synthase [Chlamydiales bacterium]
MDSSILRSYSLLTKPGIIFGNLITAAAAFMFGSRGQFDFSLFSYTVLGLGLIIASACICNNVIDQEADRMMGRTKNRPLVSGAISTKSAFLAALCMFGLGALILGWKSFLALVVALVGFSVYVLLYSFWKYRTYFATLVGSIAGAVPPVVGYAAARGKLDFGALFLFLVLVFWQMPHFFAIALFHFDDYAKASIPTLPHEKGVLRTKQEMFFYTIGFAIAALALAFLDGLGPLYLAIAAFCSVSWIALSLIGFWAKDDALWAKAMFRFSLIIIMGLSFSIAIDSMIYK